MMRLLLCLVVLTNAIGIDLLRREVGLEGKQHPTFPPPPPVDANSSWATGSYFSDSECTQNIGWHARRVNEIVDPTACDETDCVALLTSGQIYMRRNAGCAASVTPPPGLIGSVMLFYNCQPGKKIGSEDIQVYDLMVPKKCYNGVDDVWFYSELISPTVLRDTYFKGTGCHPPQIRSFEHFRSCEKSTILVAFPFAHSGDYSPSTEPPTEGVDLGLFVSLGVGFLVAICLLSFFGYHGWKYYREREGAIRPQEDLVNESFDEEENDLL
jgi:hypothetical protein